MTRDGACRYQPRWEGSEHSGYDAGETYPADHAAPAIVKTMVDGGRRGSRHESPRPSMMVFGPGSKGDRSDQAFYSDGCHADHRCHRCDPKKISCHRWKRQTADRSRQNQQRYSRREEVPFPSKSGHVQRPPSGTSAVQRPFLESVAFHAEEPEPIRSVVVVVEANSLRRVGLWVVGHGSFNVQICAMPTLSPPKYPPRRGHRVNDMHNGDDAQQRCEEDDPSVQCARPQTGALDRTGVGRPSGRRVPNPRPMRVPSDDQSRQGDESGLPEPGRPADG